jgi:predicted glutamine amidotransferase
MCEIYFIKPLSKKINEYDIKQMGIMLHSGGMHNKDGYGVTDGIKISKCEIPYTEEKLKSLLGFTNTDYIIGHVRLKTTGKQKKINSHPFYNKRFIWLHNGIIHNHKEVTKNYQLESITVDSQVIGEMLYRNVKMDKTKNIPEELKKVLSLLGGSFSVFIKDILTGKLYYFKNSGCDFYFRILNKENEYILIGSTDSSRLNSIYNENSDNSIYGIYESLYKTIGYFYPVDGVIYELTDNSFQDVNHFETIPYTYVTTTKSNYIKGFSIADIEEYLTEYYQENIIIEKIGKKKKKRYHVFATEETRISIMEIAGIDIKEYLSFKDLTSIIDMLDINSEYYYNKSLTESFNTKYDIDNKYNIDEYDDFKFKKDQEE